MTPEKVKEMRLALGLSLERFAILVGVCTGCIVRWEKGRTGISRMALEKLERLEKSTKRGTTSVEKESTEKESPEENETAGKDL